MKKIIFILLLLPAVLPAQKKTPCMTGKDWQTPVQLKLDIPQSNPGLAGEALYSAGYSRLFISYELGARSWIGFRAGIFGQPKQFKLADHLESRLSTGILAGTYLDIPALQRTFFKSKKTFVSESRLWEFEGKQADDQVKKLPKAEAGFTVSVQPEAGGELDLGYGDISLTPYAQVLTIGFIDIDSKNLRTSIGPFFGARYKGGHFVFPFGIALRLATRRTLQL